MADGPMAAWAGPIAATLAADRRSLIEFVNAVSPESWNRASVVDGWTNKDILAHLGGGNDLLVQTVLQAVTSGEQPDPAMLAPDTDAENARRVAERRTWPVAQLIAELERDGAEVQGWLAKLTDEQRDLRPAGLGMTLGEFFRVVQAEHHDLVHLEQLRGTASDA